MWEPEGFDLCAAAPTDHSKDLRQDRLDYLTDELDKRATTEGENSTPPDLRFRLNCLVIWRSAFVEIKELGFRECWLAAVATYASSHITLADSIIDGSTYAFAAIGRKAAPETAHTFEITGNVWWQSPSEYRAAGVRAPVAQRRRARSQQRAVGSEHRAERPRRSSAQALKSAEAD